MANFLNPTNISIDGQNVILTEPKYFIDQEYKDLIYRLYFEKYGEYPTDKEFYKIYKDFVDDMKEYNQHQYEEALIQMNELAKRLLKYTNGENQCI